MKTNDNFEEWVHQRMQLFASPPDAATAASRHHVLESIHAGHSTPLDNLLMDAVSRSNDRPSKPMEWLALVAMLLVIVGSAAYLQRSWLPLPRLGSRPTTPPEIGDLRTQPLPTLPPQSITLPPPATAPRARFEVASVRQEATPLNYLRFQATGDRFTTEGTSLAVLIRYAYNVATFQVIGGPDWSQDRDTQFRIQAKAEMPASTDQMREMLQSLLKDRFQLNLVHQTKQTRGYLLQVDKSGPKLRKSEDLGQQGCFPFPAKCTRTTMAGFAEYLSSVVFRMPVLDRTSLSGLFDINVEWQPDSSQFGGNGGVGFFAGNSTAPSIFTAVKEQVGLALESSMVPMEILVIDHAEMPSEN